jgi:hypothetical protein
MHARALIVPLSRGYMEYEAMVNDVTGEIVREIPSRYVRTVDYAHSVVDACLEDLKESKYL